MNDKEIFERIVRLTHKLDGPFLRDCNDIDATATYQDPATEEAWLVFKNALTSNLLPEKRFTVHEFFSGNFVVYDNKIKEPYQKWHNRKSAQEHADELNADIEEKPASKWRPIDDKARNGEWYLVRQQGVLEPSVSVCMFDDSYTDDGWWMCHDGKNCELPLRGPAPIEYMEIPK